MLPPQSLEGYYRGLDVTSSIPRKEEGFFITEETFLFSFQAGHLALNLLRLQ
jgi:hypothetical protein